MTSRRAIKHFDQKASRALQFIPGHVGGRIASAQPVERRGGSVRTVGTVTPDPPAPDTFQYWWPFDEASGTFANAGTGGTAVMKTTSSSGTTYHSAPLAPDSTYSVKVAGGAALTNNSGNFSAITPGSSGLIVFDWWMSGMTAAANASGDRMIAYFGADYPAILRVHLYKVSGSPRIRFSIKGNYYDSPDTNTVLTITSWPDPAHVKWSINPSTGAWSILMNDTSIGSGTKTNDWTGTWSPTLYNGYASTDALYYDELKVYGA